MTGINNITFASSGFSGECTLTILLNSDNRGLLSKTETMRVRLTADVSSED
jgi:hypothetical protein